jgi:uncharacterized spore protein YtfJ
MTYHEINRNRDTGRAGMIDAMLNRIGQVHERATVKTVFGEPYQLDSRTIIPIARVAYGFGFGGGRADGKAAAGDEGAATQWGETRRRAPGAGTDAADGTDAIPGFGVGGGGGAGVSVRPVAVLEMTGGETKIRPIVDVTRVVIAGMLLAAWNVFWITYTIRRRNR